MRLHSLEMSAFGPFAGSVTVDFDDLSEAGLFLLAGPTGAGKTSVLDAVCFGLYGEVPGDRAAAKHLRSDHAAAGVEPRVVLELSIGARTFRFTRSPAWMRARKRGAGDTRVPAHVVVEELTAAGWIALTNRLDDAGLLVSDLLGMTCAQFTQVAMLPQGRFQAFLRATSTERHAVLQRLFRTDRFEDVERWLVDRRADLRRASQAAQERTVGVVNRLQEASGSAVPDAWDLHDLAAPADLGEVETWAAALRDAAGVAADAAGRALETATLAAAETTAARDLATRVHTAQRRATAARADLDDLTARAAALAQTAAALDAHGRARPIAGLARRADQTAEAVDRATSALDSRLADAATLLVVDPAGLDDEVLARAQQAAAEQRAVAAAFEPREAELDRALERSAIAGLRAADLEVLVDVREVETLQLPGQIGTLQDSLAAAREAARAIVPAEQALTSARAGLVAAGRAVELGNELTRARADVQLLVDRAQDLRHEHLNVREARIHGMAAELAGGLASGCGCPVCGSAQHPSPALPAGDAVGRVQEDAARRAYEQADFERQAQQEAVLTLDAELVRATTDAGGLSVDEHTDRVAACAAAAAAGRSAETEAARLDVELGRMKEALATASTALVSAKAELSASRAAQAQAAALADQLTTELSALLAGGSHAQTVGELVDEHAGRAQSFAAARAAVRSHELAARTAAEARETAEAAAREAGFDDVATALDALLTEDAATAAADDLERAAVRSAAARAVLDDPDILELLELEVPDPDTLELAWREAVAERDRAGAVHTRTQERVARLAQLCGELDTGLAAWAPIREQYAVAAGLSAFVEGKGPDNPQRVRLSAYVLSERLRQVVDAANERLARMSDQRYSLEHTDDRGAGEVRGGLSLLVRDDWNGTRRDPATLSGGETFVVSLALALGLADTVSHEAGGTDIDTLFIDEGFGSLDSDTLEDVMDTLDSLRDGGRVVGIVSHVAELRSRITSQLEVSKSRTGSTLRLVRSDT